MYSENQKKDDASEWVILLHGLGRYRQSMQGLPQILKSLQLGHQSSCPVRNRSAKAVSSLVLQSTNMMKAFSERL
jgi:predicted esterase